MATGEALRGSLGMRQPPDRPIIGEVPDDLSEM
jgi:hypothetical protein